MRTYRLDFCAVMASADVGCVELGRANTHILTINSQACRLLHIPSSDTVTATPLSRWIHSADRPLFVSHAETVAKRKAPTATFSVRLPETATATSDGVRVEFTIVPATPLGNLLVIVRSADATAPETDSAQRWLAGLLAGTHDSIVAFDHELRFMAFNPAYEREFLAVHGVPIAQGMALADALKHRPETLAHATATLQRGLAGERFSQDIDLPNIDGVPTTYQICFEPIRDSAGRVVGVGHIAHNLSNRVEVEAEFRRDNARLEAKLSERTAKLESLLKHVPVGIAVFDREFRYVRVNPQLAEMNGLPIEAHSGQLLSELLPELASHAMPILQHVFDTGEPTKEVEMAGETPKTPGAKRYWLCGFFPVLAGNEPQPRYVGAAVLEITERKLAEEALRHVNETLERRIAERTELAQEQAAQLHRLAMELTHVEQRERRRLAETIHDHLQQLLVAAKIQASSLARKLSDTPAVADSAQNLIDLLGQSIDTARDLTAELHPPALFDHRLSASLRWLSEWMATHHDLQVEVFADPDDTHWPEPLRILLYQCVRELLLNIVKHAGVSHAAVTVSRTADQHINVEVRDEGCGFDPAQIENGTGFGLFNIRERLRRLGGDLHVQTGKGKGTRFIAAVPAVEFSPADWTESTSSGLPQLVRSPKSRRRTKTPPPSDRIRVVLVDDHEIVREGISGILRAEPDIEIVAEAQDGIEAIELARLLRPDVVVMDVNMPRLNGIEATREIRRVVPTTCVVGLSVQDDAGVTHAMKEAGASALLSKGGPTETLIHAVRLARPPKPKA